MKLQQSAAVVVAASVVIFADALPNRLDHVRETTTTPDKAHQHHRVLVRAPNGVPTFVHGNLGKILGYGTASMNDADVVSAAQGLLHNILLDKFGASGDEEMVPVITSSSKSKTKLQKDTNGKAHLRFNEKIRGMTVEGAAMVFHVEADGTVYAVNGEFASAAHIPTEPKLDSDVALSIALDQTEIQGGQWLADPELAVVYGSDGNGHLAWKNLLGYAAPGGKGPMQKDYIFASTETGDLVARHPKVYGARSLKTEDCNSGTIFCTTVSTSSDAISTGDPAIDAAHNNAIATYDFYQGQYGRDSIDGKGMTLVSRVHYDFFFNNAFWDGTQMTYGDGDGKSNCTLGRWH
jgi:bacillolysin